MRVLIAMNALKGTLSSVTASMVAARTWRLARPLDSITVLPMADGGDGTLAAAVSAGMGTFSHPVSVSGPDGTPTQVSWVDLISGDILVELAASSGLALMPQLDAMGATTRGLGETIASACAHRADRNFTLYLAVGGSASTDAGLGALRALGLKTLNAAGEPVHEGAAGLAEIARIDTSELAAPPARVVILTDVRSPLLGEHGALRFAPQKGATTDDLARIDTGLHNIVDVLRADGHTVARTPGAGAAGGTAFGFGALWNADIMDTHDFFFRTFSLDTIVAHHDLVITGEGVFDSTSLVGKSTGRLIAAAEAGGTLAAVIAGRFTQHTDSPRVIEVPLADSEAIAWAQHNPIEAVAGATKDLARKF
ncbi:MAG: glycerate kinase [Microbacteriaceae bacterium]